MLRTPVMVFAGWMLLAVDVSAFEVEAVVQRVDVDQRLLVIIARQQQRAIRVPETAKVLDAAGREVADGLRAKELRPGMRITITAERDGDRTTLRTIRLRGKAEPAARREPAEERGSAPVQQDTSGLIPLTDLGRRRYHGFPGGLYPEGENARPAGHEAAGIERARQVRPLDAKGEPNAGGKIVLLGIGFSNTAQAFKGFQEAAKADLQINADLVLVNGAVGGMSAHMIQNPDDQGAGAKYWSIVDERLRAANVTRAQVQVIWIKETNPAPHEGGFPKYVQALEGELTKIVQILPQRFPSVKLAYLSSRTYGGWALRRPDGRAPGNSEPFSYESGFAVKWLIQRQLESDPQLNYDAAKGTVKAPWLSWAAYLWTNGSAPRNDGVLFEYDDFSARDRMHESPAGQRKVGNLLLQFFKDDSTTKSWFLRPEAAGGPANAATPAQGFCSTSPCNLVPRRARPSKR